MKLAYSAWSMPKLPIDEQVKQVAALGFQGIEMICIPGSSTDVATLDSAERRRIRGLIDAAGLELPSIAGHANPLEPDPERCAANLQRIRDGLDLAVDLAGPQGPPCLVTLGYGRPETYEQERETLAERFRGLAEDARTRGVTLAFEFHVGQAIDRPDRVLWLLAHVDHPNFRLNLDVSHLDVMGYSIAESVRPLAPYSVHTHIKDQRGRYPDHAYLIPGEGDYDYPTYLREMDAAGYRGYITTEISLMVQRRPDYDPIAAAAQTFRVLTRAFQEAGLTIG